MNQLELTIRQNQILNLLATLSNSSQKISEILKIGNRTVLRDLSVLIDLNLIKIINTGKNRKYKITNFGRLAFHPDKELLDDQRLEKLSMVGFNFNLLNDLISYSIFNEEENKQLERLTLEHQKKTNKSKKEFERLIIEFSWKSSKIEGNTYSLLETEELINNNQSNRHSKEETQMIINHKKTFDYIFNTSQVDYYHNINLKKILELHKLLTEELGIKNKIRTNSVGITGSLYRPLNLSSQIEENLIRFCDLLKVKKPYEKAFLASLMISYLQPFEDGNKRTSRILTNAILYSYNLPLISYRTTTVEDYKQAILAFYEFNSLNLYKKIFLEQLEYFVKNYF